MRLEPRRQSTLSPGTPVEVFSRFSVSWVAGFEVAATRDDRYQLVRLSDHSVLPATFPIDDLRPQRRHGQEQPISRR